MNLMIPKINFRMNIYNFDSELNDVDYNIEILKDSSVIDRLFFIVGHSGMGDNCYFNDIKKLEIGDYVYLDVGDEVLIYKIIDRYYIVKNGYMDFGIDKCNRLYLITCDIGNDDKQLVLKGILIN